MNWYTSELRISLFDMKVKRGASIFKDGQSFETTLDNAKVQVRL
jgi:hypothetical protein